MSELKRKAAIAALEYIPEHAIVGVGTGSTVNYFIEELSKIKHKIDAVVVSSQATEDLIRAAHIPILDLNSVDELMIYVDGADEVNKRKELIKGGGGALTREKIIAQCAKEFICIVDESKIVSQLGAFPVAVEVIPMARSAVARELVKLGGDPEYRAGFKTDNGNIIIDVHNLILNDPRILEKQIKGIVGVVENGLFAHRIADRVIVASSTGIYEL